MAYAPAAAFPRLLVRASNRDERRIPAAHPARLALDLSTLADPELVTQALAGRPEAFDLLVERHQRTIYNLCCRMLGNPDDAADVAQEAFVRAHGALASFQTNASFSTWLHRIAANLCIDQIRKRKNAPASMDVLSQAGYEPVDGQPGPERALERSETEGIVQQAIQGLPDKYRAVVVMRHLQDMSIEQIAEAMSLPQGTVKVQLFRARELLRRQLATSGLVAG